MLFTRWLLVQASPRNRKKEPMKIKSLTPRLVAFPIALSVIASAALLVFSGCETTSHYSDKDANPPQGTNDVVLKEGDELKVIFPNGDKMDSTETIRRDGKITLPIIGDIMAAGKTPQNFQAELAEKYSKEIVSSKDISVVVTASVFPVYVMGAVSRAGKVTGDHALTALEAIMEAGGFDPDKANLKSVKVVRTQNGKTHSFIINLRGVQKPGEPVETFHLLPNDIVIVPQRFVPF
jgi:polysaccharide export outer membrane protein